jgi:hypothetical protein
MKRNTADGLFTKPSKFSGRSGLSQKLDLTGETEREMKLIGEGMLNGWCSLFSQNSFQPYARPRARESSWMSWTPHGIEAILWGVRTAHLGVHGLPRKSDIAKLEMGLKSVLLKTG